MSRETDAGRAADDGQGPSDPQVLREQVKDTRAELGDTVAALAAKADVKAMAQRKADATKEQARHAAAVVREKSGPGPLVAVAACAATVAVVTIALRRRGGGSGRCGAAWRR